MNKNPPGHAKGSKASDKVSARQPSPPLERPSSAEQKIDAKEARLEAIPESERWNPVPGSAGRQAPEEINDDEDAEGRSETEQVVEQGVEDAERDQVRQAAKAAAKKKP